MKAPVQVALVALVVVAVLVAVVKWGAEQAPVSPPPLAAPEAESEAPALRAAASADDESRGA
jgi:hypothetical protein